MKIVLLGKNGQVGWELQRALAPLGELVALGSEAVNLRDTARLRSILRDIAPNVIVNAAAYTAVDKAESDVEEARRINTEAVGVMAEEASRMRSWLVHYSTDYVFDGRKATAYLEDDATGPLSVYGRTKLEGEERLRRQHDTHLIFRTSWVYAARGQNFARTMLRLATERDTLRVVADQHGAPTSAELLADVTALALYRIHSDGRGSQALAGTYHVVADGETSWYEYARYVLSLARQKGLGLRCAPEAVEPIPTAAYPTPAARPSNSRLDTSKLRRTFNIHPPEWRYHVARLVEELTSQGKP